MLTIIITGAKGRRSTESRGGPKAGGGVQGRDGVSDGNCMSTGGSREKEGDRRGTGADGVRAAGRDADTGAVSRSEVLGRFYNPNTTPKDKERVVVCLCRTGQELH